MDEKRKSKLLKIYGEIASDRERYIKLYKSIDEFQLELEKTFDRHINIEPTFDKQVDSFLKILPNYVQNKVVHLGYIESLRSNDYHYLDRALNTYMKLSMLSVLQCGVDHCISTNKRIPYLFVLKRFKDIEKVYPKECGLSQGSYWTMITTNLIMYLYYKEHSWKEEVLARTDKYLKKKDPLEYQSIVKALLALVNKDLEGFSLELSNICKGRKKSKQFGENQFSKNVSFYSLGLYNFAQYLYPDEVAKISLPSDDNFLMDYHLYQQNSSTLDDGYIIHFNKKLDLLEFIFKVDTPCISLMKNGRNYEVDYLTYNEELINRIKAL